MRGYFLATAALAALLINVRAWAEGPGAKEEGSFEAEVQSLVPTAMAHRGIHRRCDFGVRQIAQKDAEDLLKDVMGDLPTGVIKAQQTVLQGMGLIGEDENLTDILVRQLPSQILGIYLPVRRELVLVKDPKLSPMFAGAGGEEMVRRMSLLHEITHALQDCDQDLRAISNLSDLASALSTFYEGEATYVGFRDMMPGTKGSVPPLDGLPMDAIMKMAERDPSVKAMPPVVRHALIFPYLYGLRYYTRERREGNFPVPLPTGTHAFLEGATPLDQPKAKKSTFYMQFNLGAAFFHFLYPKNHPKVLESLSGEGAWVHPVGDPPWKFVWWVQTKTTKSAKHLQKSLQKRLGKAVKVHRKDKVLAVTRAGLKKPPLPWPEAFGPDTTLAHDVAATPRAEITLAKGRWDLEPSGPFAKTLRHNRYPVVLSLTEFRDTPTLTHFPEPEVWRAQSSAFCADTLADQPREDTYATTCLTPDGKALRLHARVLSFEKALVMVTCAGQARQWQAGFEDLCREVLASAKARHPNQPTVRLTPRP